MEMKQNRPDGGCFRHGRQRRGIRPITGGILALMFFALSCPFAHAIGPYAAGNNTVIDQRAGLEWQKSNDATTRTWQNGLAYCEDLSLDAKTDWRLPSIRELKSLVNDSRYYPAIDPAFTCQSFSYWSSTSVTDQPKSAWVVHFGNGDDNWYVKTDNYRVRCVRAGILSRQP